MGHGRARVIFVAHVCSFFKMGDSNVLAAFVLRGLKTVTTCFLTNARWALIYFWHTVVFVSTKS